MRKQGEMTMKYLLTFVLAGVLLALVIYGVQGKGFGPLIDNIEGRANEVLIFLNIKDDVSISCGKSFKENIVGVGDGEFYPCPDSCTFVVLNSKELLGYNNFTVDANGFSLISADGKSFDNNKVFTLDPVEAERQREAFLILNKTIWEFLDSNGMSEKDFVKAMSFDRGRKLYFAVDDSGDDTAYLYEDASVGNWTKGEIEKGMFVAKGKAGDFLKTDEVKQEILFSYGIWWVKDEEEVYSGYLETSNKKDVYDKTFVSKVDFEKRFDALSKWQEDFSKGYVKLGGDLTTFLDNKGEVNFMGEQVNLTQGYSTPRGVHHSLAVTLWISENDQFHIYYENSNLKFSHNFQDSDVSRYADLQDSEWEEFTNINKIYQHFKLKRCVKS